MSIFTFLLPVARMRPAYKIRVKTGHFIKFHSGGAVQVDLRSFQIVSAFLAQAMDSKRLQSADIRLATSQLIALLEAESMPLLMLGFPMKLSQADRQDQATRAVQAFMLIYGNSSAGNRQSKLTPRATLDCP